MARGAILWQAYPSACEVNSSPGGGSSSQNTQALAGRSCDTCSVVGCDHEYCYCPLRVCLVPNTPRWGKLVSTRPSALLYCFAEAHHAEDRRFFQALLLLSPVSGVLPA
jgi:hypothetical protein